MALTNKLTAIANAIRSKTGGTDLMSLEDMPTAIEGISGGGGSGNPTAESKDVNFIDYDGTIRYSYTAEDFAALSALPENPTHSGLTSQGWNWSLSDAKTYVASYGKLWIGQMYVTDDGKTRIYIHLEEGRTSPMLGCCPNGTVTVDWGDGTDPDTLTGTSIDTVQWTGNHAYASAGDYVITLTVSGSVGFSGSNSSDEGPYLLRATSGSKSINSAYRNAIRKIELSDNITSISNYAFRGCGNLSSITIPNKVRYFSNYIFQNCYSLSSIVIPKSVYSIQTSAFQNCYSLSSIAIPKITGSISNYAFHSCYSLSGITIPNSITSIGTYAFYGCTGVAFYDFSTYTSVPKLSSGYVFSLIPPDCKIRVPSELYDEWIAATNWSGVASKIVAV